MIKLDSVPKCVHFLQVLVFGSIFMVDFFCHWCSHTPLHTNKIFATISSLLTLFHPNLILKFKTVYIRLSTAADYNWKKNIWFKRKKSLVSINTTSKIPCFPKSNRSSNKSYHCWSPSTWQQLKFTDLWTQMVRNEVSVAVCLPRCECLSVCVYQSTFYNDHLQPPEGSIGGQNRVVGWGVALLWGWMAERSTLTPTASPTPLLHIISYSISEWWQGQWQIWWHITGWFWAETKESLSVIDGLVDTTLGLLFVSATCDTWH